MIIFMMKRDVLVSFMRRVKVVRLPIRADIIRRLIFVFLFRMIVTAMRRKRSIMRFRNNTRSIYTFILVTLVSI